MQQLPWDIIEHIALNAETIGDYLKFTQLSKVCRFRLFNPHSFKRFLVTFFDESDYVIRYLSLRIDRSDFIRKTWTAFCMSQDLMRLDGYSKTMLKDYFKCDGYKDARLEFLRALIGFNMDHPNIQEFVDLALIEAVRMNELEIVKFILENKHSSHDPLFKHNWLTMYINDSKVELLKYLLDQGVRIPSEPSIACLVLIDNEAFNAVRILLHHLKCILPAAEFTEALESIWSVCANAGTHQIIDVILDDFNIHPTFANNTGILLAIRNEDAYLLERFFKCGLDITELTTDTPFFSIISITSSVEIVRVLIENGAEVNEGDGYPLMVAIRTGKFEIVNCLLEHGASVTSSIWSVAQAVQKDHPEIYASIRAALLDDFQ